MFHNGDDDNAIIFTNLVYSPRACLWEHHVYCAVSSTSMECNICHGCHSQWRCHFGPLATGLPSAEQTIISNTEGGKLKRNCNGIYFIVYTTLHKCRGGSSVHTSNIPDLLALIYHALVKFRQLNVSGIFKFPWWFNIHFSHIKCVDLTQLKHNGGQHRILHNHFFPMLPCVFHICVFLYV